MVVLTDIQFIIFDYRTGMTQLLILMFPWKKMYICKMTFYIVMCVYVCVGVGTNYNT